MNIVTEISEQTTKENSSQPEMTEEPEKVEVLNILCNNECGEPKATLMSHPHKTESAMATDTFLPPITK